MKLVLNLRSCIISAVILIAGWSPMRPATLIPRTVLFGNPEKGYAQVSPDATRVAYCAPVNGVLNIWVKTVGEDDDKAITFETTRGISYYYWAYNSKKILYFKDTNGDENYHCYCIDLLTRTTRNLTPFAGVKASLIALSKHVPDEIVVMTNKENPKLFDAYRLNLISGDISLEASNPGNVTFWIADKNLCGSCSDRY